MEVKRVIIVGSSSGMGRELARIYARNGARVAVTGRRTELLKELEQEFPGQVMQESFDVMQMKNIDHLQKLIDQLGGMDLFVVSAGIGTVSKDLDWEIDKETIDTNVNAFVQMVNWAFNFFVKQGYGQIANISSIASLRGNSWAPAYSASKAFQSVYFEGLYMKAKKMKTTIQITDIVPGFVHTKMSQGNKRFWVATVEKAGKQIYEGIESKKFRVYVTKRWRLVAWMMKWAPGFLYHPVG
jgi:short-subunit dehydrogenase